MEATLVDEKKLEELIDRAVQKRFKPNLQDMDEVRKSPAGMLIRIENRLESLEARIERDMVTRAEMASFRNEIKEEIASTRGELANNRAEVANTRVGLKDEIANLGTAVANTRGDLKGDIANNRADIATTRTELKDDIATTRTELKDEIAKKHDELKDAIWNLKLLVIVWGIITILTNPKVVDLIGKLFNLFKP